MSNNVFAVTGLLLRVNKFLKDLSICSRPVSIKDVCKENNNKVESYVIIAHMFLFSFNLLKSLFCFFCQLLMLLVMVFLLLSLFVVAAVVYFVAVVDPVVVVVAV